MRIIDDITSQEVTSPDLSAGYIYEGVWASPAAYATIDNVEKFALYSTDYEQVEFYHRWTDDEVAQRIESERQQDHNEMMDSMPDAFAELSMAVSDGAADTADLADALAELSEIVSQLMEGA